MIMATRPGIFSKCRKYPDFLADNECSNRSQDVSSPEPMPTADNPHYEDSSELVYGNPEGVVTDFPMPYYSYPAQGGPVSEEYDSPFESNLLVNYTILNDTNVIVQEYSTAFSGHSFDKKRVKMEIDPPCEGLGSLISWDSFMCLSSLNMGKEHDHLWPTSALLSDPFSSVSDLDMMRRTRACILAEVGSEQTYSTSSPALEKDEQDFSETAEAVRMQTLVTDGFGLQSPIGEDQQSEGTTDEDDDDNDGGDFVMVMMMMKDQMEEEQEGMDNQEEAGDEVMEAKEEGMAEVVKVEEEEDQEGKAEDAEVVDPDFLLRQQLLDERIRNPEPNWGPYRPSNETLASMRNYIQALENRLLLSRAGWSSNLLEELFGSTLMNGQWPWPPPPPAAPPPPPPPSN